MRHKESAQSGDISLPREDAPPTVSRLLLSVVIVCVWMFVVSRGLLWIWRAL